MPVNSEDPSSPEQSSIKDLVSMTGTVTPETAAVLDRALSGADITPEEAVVLFAAEGQD